jgi:8-oxo-dGTP pyrophosphatase MutT (NUDIX family)
MAAAADMKKRINVVTVFLEYNNKILILKRSNKVKTMKSKWAGVSGYIEQEPPIKRALKEIEEETGLHNENVNLRRIGEPFEAVDASVPELTWIVNPFLFSSNTDQVRIDWEHEEYRWIYPKEIENYETVPGLAYGLEMVLQT